MTTYRVSEGRLEEVRVGGFIDINGERRRITRMSVEEAPEDVPELRIKAGDLVTTVELEQSIDPPPEAIA